MLIGCLNLSKENITYQTRLEQLKEQTKVNEYQGLCSNKNEIIMKRINNIRKKEMTLFIL